MLTENIFRTKSNIYDGAFSTLVKPYFKNILNSIKLPLGSIFYTTHIFVKKFTTLKTSGEKVFVNNGTFFKAISKDVRKTIVPSFMFLFNSSKSVVLCVKKM